MTLVGFLTTLLEIILCLAVVAGIIWAVEFCIAPIPDKLKVLIAVIVLIILLIWFLSGGGHFINFAVIR